MEDIWLKVYIQYRKREETKERKNCAKDNG